MAKSVSSKMRRKFGVFTRKTAFWAGQKRTHK